MMLKNNRSVWSLICDLLLIICVWPLTIWPARIYISIQRIFSPSPAVSQCWPPRADYEVELVCGESERGVSVCALHASPSSIGVHGSLWFGPVSEHQASVETRVWCGLLAQGFPLEQTCSLDWLYHLLHSVFLLLPLSCYLGFEFVFFICVCLSLLYPFSLADMDSAQDLSCTTHAFFRIC